jgi:hypothetical protein
MPICLDPGSTRRWSLGRHRMGSARRPYGGPPEVGPCLQDRPNLRGSVGGPDYASRYRAKKGTPPVSWTSLFWAPLGGHKKTVRGHVVVLAVPDLFWDRTLFWLYIVATISRQRGSRINSLNYMIFLPYSETTKTRTVAECCFRQLH